MKVGDCSGTERILRLGMEVLAWTQIEMHDLDSLHFSELRAGGQAGSPV